MIITSLLVRQIFDSRGEPTIEITATSGAVSARASVPSGKSRGSGEVSVFSIAEAHIALAYISKYIVGHELNSVRALDERMIAADGTAEKSKVGGNVMLGISIAVSRLFAMTAGVSHWQSMRSEFFPGTTDGKNPIIFSNLINGGVHAKNNLTIQEYMVVLRTTHSYEESISRLVSLYRHLGEALVRAKGYTGRPPIGDEGGYAFDFKDNFEPIEFLSERIREDGMGDFCSIGLDVAASSFFENEKYVFGGVPLSGEELLRTYTSYFEKEKLLCTIEDPFAESDPEMFATLSSALGTKWVVGDDLTVTRPAFIKKYCGEKYVNGVIIKPNQIGTVSETCDAIRAVREGSGKTIVSHRSGETEDTFIIELAKASAADAVKIGAPTKERMIKFNELIRLYESS